MSADTVGRLNAALEGRYHIERQLGEGGMATVYLADDLRHERKVALKVLKPELAAVVGADRFLAEIKTTANLQHPHILPLFDSGEADGFLFYVMPYIEGESLREKLDREHQLPVDEAVQIAQNVAEALDYAHSHGVIHRDIKPANILLQAGKPVVSDFGIALAVGTAGAGRLTETGLSLGTPHYMSPEQATGDLSVGAATDVYALGCVLYEMLVAEPPYTGGTPQAILGKIVTGEPDPVRKLRRSVPPNVDAAIRRALEKVPADRFATAKELATALADPGFRHGDAALALTTDGGRFWRRTSLGLAAALVLVGGFGAWLVLRPAPADPVTRFEVNLPDGVSAESAWRHFAISPDGRIVVFADDLGQLYWRPLDETDPIPIPNTAEVWYPFFSPEGESVAYFDDDELKRVRLDDGFVQTLTRVLPGIRSGVWLPDHTIVFYSNFAQFGNGLWSVSDVGGDPVKIVEDDGGGYIRWMSPIPGRRAVLASQRTTDGQDQVIVVSLETGERTVLFGGHTARYAAGHVVFWRDDAVWAVRFDTERLEPVGDPAPMVEGVTTESNGLAHFAVGGDVLFYREGINLPDVPLWIDRDGTREVLDSTLSGVFGAPDFSPDGTKIALEYNTPAENTQDIYVYDLETGTLSRVTSEGSPNRYPFWSPDGLEIGFSSQRDSLPSLWARPVDLSAEAHVLLADDADAVHEGSFTPDGRFLIHRFGSSLTNVNEDIRYVALDGGSAPVNLLATPVIERNPALSPDGRCLAYTSQETGERQVYLRPFPGPAGRIQISREGASQPVWSESGELFYESDVPPYDIVAVEAHTEPDCGFDSQTDLFATNGLFYAAGHPEWAVAPDGQRFLFLGPRPSDGATGRYLVIEGLSQVFPN